MSALASAALVWEPIRPQLLTLAHLLHGTCRCGRPNGRPGRRYCCYMCAHGYRHGHLCTARNGIPR